MMTHVTIFRTGEIKEMRRTIIQFVLCGFIFCLMTSCAHAPVQLCENSKCTPLTESDSKDAAFLKLTALIKSNLGKEIPFMFSAAKGGAASRDIVVEWLAAATPGNAKRLAQIHSITFTDIFFIDRDKKETKIMARIFYSTSNTWTAMSGFHPAGSHTLQMPCTLTVKSPQEIIFQGRGKMGYYDIYFDSLIDQINIDKTFWTSAFDLSIVGVGPNGTGVRDGYIRLSFPNSLIKEYAAITASSAVQSKRVQQTG